MFPEPSQESAGRRDGSETLSQRLRIGGIGGLICPSLCLQDEVTEHTRIASKKTFKDSSLDRLCCSYQDNEMPQTVKHRSHVSQAEGEDSVEGESRQILLPMPARSHLGNWVPHGVGRNG